MYPFPLSTRPGHGRYALIGHQRNPGTAPIPPIILPLPSQFPQLHRCCAPPPLVVADSPAADSLTLTRTAPPPSSVSVSAAAAEHRLSPSRRRRLLLPAASVSLAFECFKRHAEPTRRALAAPRHPVPRTADAIATERIVASSPGRIFSPLRLAPLRIRMGVKYKDSKIISNQYFIIYSYYTFLLNIVILSRVVLAAISCIED